MGHTGLNSALHIIGKYPTGQCEWCRVRETVGHESTKIYKDSKSELTCGQVW